MDLGLRNTVKSDRLDPDCLENYFKASRPTGMEGQRTMKMNGGNSRKNACTLKRKSKEEMMVKINK